MPFGVFPEQLPQRVRDDPKLSAEVRLYDLLRTQLGFGWSIFYDVAWFGLLHPSDGPRDGQVDFIVAHPDKGILLIEVKGGRIRFDGPRRQWFSTDRDGVDHEIDPFTQVRKCKYALLNKLLSIPALRNRWLELSHAVAFPGCARPTIAVTPDAPAEIIIGAEDLDRLEARIEEILAYCHGQSGSPFRDGRLLIRELTGLVAQTVALPNPLAVAMLDEQREMIRLTESQLRVLGLLKRVRRAAIGGGAGSGKTFLAVEKAKQLAREGFRTLLTCHTEPLAGFLRHLSIETSNLDVLSVRGLHDRYVRAAKKSVVPHDQVDPSALFDALDSSAEQRYDAVIVDEGQDFTADWWLAFENCLREGRDSVFYVFHDTHQALDRRGGTLPDGMAELSLEDNVRNTQAICRVLTRHYSGEVKIAARGPVGRSVETIPYRSQSELAQELGRALRRLMTTERIDNRDIVVLTPRRLQDSNLLSLQLPGNLRLVPTQPATRSEHCLCASVGEFKGLERRVAVVAELDSQLPLDPSLRSAVCYVAFSRPRHHLVLLGTPDVLSELVS
jgi:hypothetical protein